MFVVILLCFFFSQDRGETDCVVAWRERNETFIESFVIKCREADAIAGIQTVLFCPFLRFVTATTSSPSFVRSKWVMSFLEMVLGFDS